MTFCCIVVVSQLAECSEGSSIHCQPYRLECDLKPGSFFNAFNCSVAITAYINSCIELHPPVDICHQITISSVTDGVETEANGGLINATVCSCVMEAVVIVRLSSRIFLFGGRGREREERTGFVS